MGVEDIKKTKWNGEYFGEEEKEKLELGNSSMHSRSKAGAE